MSSDDALRLVEEAVAALTPIGDDAGLAIAWQVAGQVQNMLGDMDQVRAAMQCALGHARRARHNASRIAGERADGAQRRDDCRGAHAAKL